ncbi:MAG: hypothetical protein PHD23_02900 [Eubacteriales bacterium]|nr:hypothetical protein [Eubacteriales bacterium]
MTNMEKQLKYLQGSLFTEHNLDLSSIGGRWLDASLQELVNGKISSGSALYTSLASIEWSPVSADSQGNNKQTGFPVCVVAKSINFEDNSSRKKRLSLDDRIIYRDTPNIQSLFFIPALLSGDGSLLPGKWQWPWFDSHWIGSDDRALIDADKYQEYKNKRDGLLKNIPDWKTWLSLSADLYQNVTGQSFSDHRFSGFDLESNIFIIPDYRVMQNMAVYKSYETSLPSMSDDIIIDRLISPIDTEKTNRRWPNNIQLSFSHSGHADYKHALPVSHRRVLEQILSSEDQSYTAINAPLGTNPEVCIADVIASRIVNAAVLEDKPPLMAVLVKNAYEQVQWAEALKMESVVIEGDENVFSDFGSSWIGSECGLGVAVSSSCNAKFIKNHNLLSIGTCSDLGLASYDNPQYIKEASESVIEKCSKYFNEKMSNLENCRSKIHETLVSVNFARQSLLQTGIKIKDFMQKNSVSQDQLFFPEDELNQIVNKRQKLVERLDEWRKHFKALPISLRIGANNDLGKIKIKAYYEVFRTDEETSQMPDVESFEDVENGLAAIDRELAREEAILDEIVHQQDKTERMIRKLEKIGLDIELMEKYISQPEKINVELDRSLRLLAFWLAVHYYECRWLSGESIVLMHQRNRTDEKAAIRYLNRLSLISPCLISEKHLLLNMNGIGANSLHDLFIVSAQDIRVSEIMPLFNKAKRVHLFGDLAASEITSFMSLDQAWVKPERNHINELTNHKSYDLDNDNSSDKQQFFVAGAADGIGQGGSVVVDSDEIVRSAITAICPMDVLSLAAEKSNWFMLGRNGMWLSDNLRSFEEIVSYGSWLKFDDKIKPVRGSSADSRRKIPWSSMSLWQVDSSKTEKVGRDLLQPKEVDEIIRWLKANYETLRTTYADEDKDRLIAIVTPFASQKNQIIKALDKEFKHIGPADIKVGLLEEFVDVESYKLIILSAVYNRSDGCQLFEADSTYLYKTVNLAEDMFIYFGDVNALPEKGRSPAVQLRRKLKPLNRKK